MSVDMMDSATILIIDDSPENLGLVFEFLNTKGYQVLLAEDGPSGLNVVERDRPDLILLDVMMPGMNGFQVCNALKQMPGLQEIPVIFMSALTDIVDKLKGFEVGGVDYVTKPVQCAEVEARVRAHLTITRLRQELLKKNHELADKNRFLEEKNAELDAFSHMVAHDLKNPLHSIVGFTSILEEYHSEELTLDGVVCVQHIAAAGEKAVEIIEALLLMAGTSRHRQLVLEPIDTASLIANVTRRLEEMINDSRTQLEIPAVWPSARGYPLWVEEVWFNYISNAIKYGGSPPRIVLHAEVKADCVCFKVRDNGPGLSTTEQEKLFIPFTRLHTERADGHGLGLSIVRKIITRLGGEVGVESEPGQGSTFYFTLPTPPEDVSLPSSASPRGG